MILVRTLWVSARFWVPGCVGSSPSQGYSQVVGTSPSLNYTVSPVCLAKKKIKLFFSISPKTLSLRFDLALVQRLSFQHQGKSAVSAWLPWSWDRSLALDSGSDWNVHPWLSWYSGLQSQAGTIILLALPLHADCKSYDISASTITWANSLQ